MNNTNWIIDNTHSEISFKVKHMMILSVTGHFEDFEATAKTDGENFNNVTIEFKAKTGSINTKNKERDTPPCLLDTLRCVSFGKRPAHIKHIWFSPKTLANTKKPKELNSSTPLWNYDFEFLLVGYITCCSLN